jgi:hypothetical protein
VNRFQAWLLPLHVALLAMIIPDVSRWLPLQSLLRLFTPQEAGWPYAGMSADQILGVIQRRLRDPWRMRGRRCLRFGLLGFYFLRRAGFPVVLHFGVYVTGEAREKAHCWLTLDGRILADPPGDPHVLVLTHGAAQGEIPVSARA